MLKVEVNRLRPSKQRWFEQHWDINFCMKFCQLLSNCSLKIISSTSPPPIEKEQINFVLNASNFWQSEFSLNMGQSWPIFGLFHIKVYKLWQLQVTVKWTFPHLDLLTSSLGPSHRGRESLVGVHRCWFLQPRMPLMPTEVDTMSVFLLFESNVRGCHVVMLKEKEERRRRRRKQKKPSTRRELKPTSSWLWGVCSTTVLQPRPNKWSYIKIEFLYGPKNWINIFWF